MRFKASLRLISGWRSVTSIPIRVWGFQRLSPTSDASKFNIFFHNCQTSICIYSPCLGIVLARSIGFNEFLRTKLGGQLELDCPKASEHIQSPIESISSICIPWAFCILGLSKRSYPLHCQCTFILNCALYYCSPHKHLFNLCNDMRTRVKSF